jgi:hypothetical protein
VKFLACSILFSVISKFFTILIIKNIPSQGSLGEEDIKSFIGAIARLNSKFKSCSTGALRKHPLGGDESGGTKVHPGCPIATCTKIVQNFLYYLPFWVQHLNYRT